MGARKLLHEEVNRVNKLLTKRKSALKKAADEHFLDSDDFIVEDNHEKKVLPYKRKLLVKQYYKLRETLADYIDNAQVKLFDQAIRIMDRVHIGKDNNKDN